MTSGDEVFLVQQKPSAGKKWHIIRKYEIKYENTKLNPKLKIISYFRIS